MSNNQCKCECFFFPKCFFCEDMSQSGTILSLNTAGHDQSKPALTPTATPKSKRATSFVRKKPPLERGLSAQSALRVNRNAFVCK